ncbi:MAG: threonine/serine exporter ThrE family protein [Phycisphaerales bacterium JB065]
MTENPIQNSKPAPRRERVLLSFMVMLGEALHAAGTTAGRLETILSAVARAHGYEAHVFSTPTSFTIALGEPGQQRLALCRTQPAEADLGRLVAVDEVASWVARREMSLSAGRRELAIIAASKPLYRTRIIMASFGVAAACAARFFSGTWVESVVAGLLGIVVGMIVIRFQKSERSARVADFLAGSTAALIAVLADRYFFQLDTTTVALSAIIVLIPGLTLTVAVSEISTLNLVSGSARLIGAIAVLVALAIGIGIGFRLGGLLTHGIHSVEVASIPPEWTKAIAIPVAAAAFTIIFRARPRDYLPILAAGAVGFYGGQAGALAFGPELGAAVGALAVGLASNIWSRIKDQPAAVTILPGLILLVPGSLGLRGVYSFLTEDSTGAVEGVDAAASMLLVAVSLVFGLLLANGLFPSRKPL